MVISEDVELQFSHRCSDEAFARRVANGLKQDHLKTRLAGYPVLGALVATAAAQG